MTMANKIVLAVVMVLTSSVVGISIVQSEAEARCYGPAFPDHPMCRQFEK